MASITFLGTGGGRFVLLNQQRYSGGIWLDLDAKAILDPGPGSLVRALQYGKKPTSLDAVIVSHRHLDHYNDAELMLEAMTYGMKKERGTMVLNAGVVDYISEYHRDYIKPVIARPGKEFKINRLEVEPIPTYNHDDGCGFRFKSSKGTVTFTSDTAYSKDLIPYYKDSRILVLNTIFPRTKDLDVHLNTRTAAEIVKAAKPELAVITHFGLTMLREDPKKEAKWMEEETGIRTIAAEDGMKIDLETLNAPLPVDRRYTQTRLF